MAGPLVGLVEWDQCCNNSMNADAIRYRSVWLDDFEHRRLLKERSAALPLWEEICCLRHNIFTPSMHIHVNTPQRASWSQNYQLDDTATVAAPRVSVVSRSWLHSSSQSKIRTYDWNGIQSCLHQKVPQRPKRPIDIDTRYKSAVYAHAKSHRKQSLETRTETGSLGTGASTLPSPTNSSSVFAHGTSPLPPEIRSFACWRYCSQRACSTRAAASLRRREPPMQGTCA